jgi:uncharacterized protein YndB with AHSA1/START domain
MADILHRVGIDAPSSKVFEAISTVAGLRGWWTAEASGDAGNGGLIDFGFCEMKVTTSKPNELIQWRCTRGPDDWVNTEVSFRLISKEGQTFVLFKHANWKQQVEFMHHCSTKWAVFLLSLKDWIERGEGRPAPRDVKIHVGD